MRFPRAHATPDSELEYVRALETVNPVSSYRLLCIGFSSLMNAEYLISVGHSTRLLLPTLHSAHGQTNTFRPDGVDGEVDALKKCGHVVSPLTRGRECPAPEY